jgi:hypothetical protein
MSDSNRDNKTEQVSEIMRTYTGLVMEVLEQNFGHDKNWQGARSRVLRLLGDNGLSKRVRELFEQPPLKDGGV